MTDVIVLAISVASTLQADEVWVTYGSGKNVQNIPAHAVAMSLGPDKASTLPMFHNLTRCDTVSLFSGCGKKTEWDVWKVFPKLTPILRALKASPTEKTEEWMAVLERFVVLLYDRTSSLMKGYKPSFVSQCFQAHQTGVGSDKTTYGHRTGSLPTSKGHLL